MKSRRLLITGIGGFVGSWIAQLAVRQNFEVHGLVRPGHQSARLSDCAVTLHDADLRDAARVTALVEAIKPECVVHAAFSASHPTDAAARREMFESGVAGTANLLEALRSTDSVERFVHVGSATVYGPSARPHRVEDPLTPATFRGVCKASASLLCRQFAATTATNCAEVRLFSVYGPWEQPRRLLPALLRAALDGTVVKLTKEPRVRNWIYVEDAAEACLAALRLNGRGLQVFHAGTEQVLSTHEFARAVEQITGRTLIGGFDYPSADPYGDVNPQVVLPQAADGIDWQPRHEFKDALRHSWSWAQTADGRRHWGSR